MLSSAIKRSGALLVRREDGNPEGVEAESAHPIKGRLMASPRSFPGLMEIPQGMVKHCL